MFTSRKSVISYIFSTQDLYDVLIGDVHRVDEIIPGGHNSAEQLISVLFLELLLFRGQGLLNFLKLLI